MVGARRDAAPAGRARPAAAGAAMARRQAELARLHALWDGPAGERRWAGRFTRPVSARATVLGFAARPGSGPGHAGVDFAAAPGATVVAANHGRVALVAAAAGPGRLVVLDHGLGLFTLYGHLARVDVREGDLVERGQALGALGPGAGATRADLHWAAQVRRARVNPLALLSLPVAD